jgi:hypothetical protein
MAIDAQSSLRWLAVCRHKIRRFRAPYLLLLQHHIVLSKTRIVAPVIASNGVRTTFLTPNVTVGSVDHFAMLLDMISADVSLIGAVVTVAEVDEDAVTDGLDAIFRGYPVGLPI